MDAILTMKTQELAKELAANSNSLGDLNTAIRSLMKSALEQMLNTEMDVHLASASNKSAPIKRNTRRITQS